MKTDKAPVGALRVKASHIWQGGTVASWVLADDVLFKVE